MASKACATEVDVDVGGIWLKVECEVDASVLNTGFRISLTQSAVLMLCTLCGTSWPDRLHDLTMS